MRDARRLPVLGTDEESECGEGCCAPSKEGGNGEKAEAGSAAGRTVVRVEGMDCASCAVTVERRVASLPGVERATVNFAAGRLDVQHDESVTTGGIERAVEQAGYGVGRNAAAERTPLWRSPRVLLTAASALLFGIGAALQLSGVGETVRLVPYAAALLVGGMPIFRAAISALRARHLDMNVLMSVAAIGAAGIGAWGEAALVVTLFAAGNALQVFAVDRTRNAVRALARLAPGEVLVRFW